MFNILIGKWFEFHVRYITVHYAYIISFMFLGSFMVVAAGNLRYIDALFFASGSATQSGLNTVDVNQIYLYQQIVLHLIPIFCNPIFINTMVVLIRIMWFNQKFKDVVRLAKQPSRARTLSMSQHRTHEVDEAAVRGREIKVLHNTGNGKMDVVEGPDGLFMKHTDETPSTSSRSASRSVSRPGTAEKRDDDSEVSPRTSLQELNPPSVPMAQQGSTGAHSVSNSVHSYDVVRALPRADDDLAPHIAFVENQRTRKDKALRIPGPREFERGEGAVEVDDDNDALTLNRARTRDEKTNNGGPSVGGRSYSFARAASNASIRLRKISTFDRVLPTAGHALTSAFTMGVPNKPAHKMPKPFTRNTPKEQAPMPYLSYTPTMGRNSQFVDLSDDQKEELGGIEYRSLKLLLYILMGYMFFFHIFAIIFLLPWVMRNEKSKEYINSVGVNPAWWAIFTAQSAFNDVGFSLTPDSMLRFYDQTWVLLAMTFLIIIGNTAFPCMLRLIIWIMFKLSPKSSGIRESLNFLLDHPRRCFTLLFPARETWILFGTLLALNVADVILFIVLDLNDPDIAHIPTGHRLMDAIFQAASTRTAGFSVVNLADLHPAVQVSYMIMMYISIFPIAISVRKTNVYEEKSLGIYKSDEEEEHMTAASYVGTHLRKQLSFDLWYIFAGLFIITIVEGPRIENNAEYSFTVFSILFEVVSAYGTVGLSLGHPSKNTSLAGMFGTVSKLVLIAMQIRGRHRGLPYEIDRAIMLPRDLQDNEHGTLRRRSSVVSRVSTVGRAPTHASAYGRPFSQPADGSVPTTPVRQNTAPENVV